MESNVFSFTGGDFRYNDRFIIIIIIIIIINFNYNYFYYRNGVRTCENCSTFMLGLLAR